MLEAAPAPTQEDDAESTSRVFKPLEFCQVNTFLRRPVDPGRSPGNCSARAGKVRQLAGEETGFE